MSRLKGLDEDESTQRHRSDEGEPQVKVFYCVRQGEGGRERCSKGCEILDVLAGNSHVAEL